MHTDNDALIFGLLSLGVFALIALWLVGLIPAWLVIQGQWESFPWWLSANIQVSRVLVGLLLCPLYLLLSLTGKLHYFPKAVNAGILAIWGYPLYREALMNLAYIELSGLVFQRTILLIVFVLGMEISLFNTKEETKDDH